MASALKKGMQNRKGLINGGPNGNRVETDEEEVKKKIDRMAYVAAVGMGIFLGSLIALYLTGGI